MSDLTRFTFEDQALRIIDHDGEPWFVLKDVLSAMGSTRHTTQAIQSVDQNLGKGYINDVPLSTRGGMQSTFIAAEPAVTFLVSRSNTEAGQRLNRFIHTEVLPSLRKTGSYHINPAPAAAPAPSPAPTCVRSEEHITIQLSKDDYIRLLDFTQASAPGVWLMLSHPDSDGKHALGDGWRLAVLRSLCNPFSPGHVMHAAQAGHLRIGEAQLALGFGRRHSSIR